MAKFVWFRNRFLNRTWLKVLTQQSIDRRRMRVEPVPVCTCLNIMIPVIDWRRHFDLTGIRLLSRRIIKMMVYGSWKDSFLVAGLPPTPQSTASLSISLTHVISNCVRIRQTPNDRELPLRLHVYEFTTRSRARTHNCMYFINICARALFCIRSRFEQAYIARVHFSANLFIEFCLWVCDCRRRHTFFPLSRTRSCRSIFHSKSYSPSNCMWWVDGPFSVSHTRSLTCGANRTNNANEAADSNSLTNHLVN